RNRPGQTHYPRTGSELARVSRARRHSLWQRYRAALKRKPSTKIAAQRAGRAEHRARWGRSGSPSKGRSESSADLPERPDSLLVDDFENQGWLIEARKLEQEV